MMDAGEVFIDPSQISFDQKKSDTIPMPENFSISEQQKDNVSASFKSQTPLSTKELIASGA